MIDRTGTELLFEQPRFGLGLFRIKAAEDLLEPLRPLGDFFANLAKIEGHFGQVRAIQQPDTEGIHVGPFASIVQIIQLFEQPFQPRVGDPAGADRFCGVGDEDGFCQQEFEELPFDGARAAACGGRN